MAANGGKSTKGEKQEKRLDFWANILAGFAIISAVTAVMFALLWGITSSYASYENYKVLEEIDMGNGQRFKVEYPSLVLADDTPANLIITLNAPIDNNKNVKITFPEEIRLSDYRENASVRLIEKQFTSSAGKDDRVIKFVFYHSKTVMGNLLYGNQVVKIESAYLPNGILNVKIPMETNRWAGIRSFVNNSVEDKSPLILLASGLISWAGSYLLQFIKDKRERQKDFEQLQREDRKKYEEDLLSSFQKNPVLAVRGFIEDCEKGGYEEYKDIYLKLEIAGCHRSMIENIFALWHAGVQSEAKLVIKDLVSLKNNFSTPDHFSKEIKMIEILHEIALLPDTASIKEEDLKEILDAYVLWREALNLILIPIIRKAVGMPSNLPNMKKVFSEDSFIGIPLLRDARIQDKLIWYWEDPERVLTKDESEILTDDQKKRIKDERSSAAKDLYRRLSTNIKWKPLWQQKEIRCSDRLNKWLKSHDPEFTDFSFGEELAELDGESLNLKKVKNESFEKWAEHPSLENIWHAKPLLMFAGEGMGKTASAYYLVDICRNPKPEKNSRAFPVYATFQSTLGAKEWIVTSVARALIDFISENPRHFLDAKLAQRVAMGRLILFYEKTLDRVKVAFKQSGHNSNDDWSQILTQLYELVPQSAFKKKLTDADVKNLLHSARPDGFSRTFFILDVSNMLISTEKLDVIKELGHLILPLMQADFFIKTFLPIELKAGFDKTLLEMFSIDLMWNEDLLQEMLKLRFERFTAVCDVRRTVRSPLKLIAAASSGSPRRAIRYGNALMRYAEENLEDFQKLDINAFETVSTRLINSGAFHSSGGEG